MSINPNKPNQAISTERITKAVLPEDFKIVSDKQSNGYKYLNLLYGTEIDIANRLTKDTYKNGFLNSIDLSKEYNLYELNLSGIPISNYLNASGIPIKITNEFEFFKGSPTRLVYKDLLDLPTFYITYSGDITPSSIYFNNSFISGYNTPCWSELSSITGLEYVKKDLRGSGYLLISSDISQDQAYVSGLYPMISCEVNTNLIDSGDILNLYGLFPGLKNQNYSETLKQEVIYPIDSRTLSGQYPLYRTIVDDSGYMHTIDHYEPYNGWTKNAFGNIVAYLSYSGDFYYNEYGIKTYFRTAKNNPYGYGNYNTAYIDLQYTPISGTLKVYDIDNLDISGNAIEIPSNGKSLYYYKSDKMLIGESGEFDPIYIGYDSIVPSGYGFSSNMEGSGCSLFKTTTWNYLHDSGYYDDGSLTYIDGSGDITNKISISNYYSRYLVEYKYKIYDKVKYITTNSNNGTVSLNTRSPILTVYNNTYNEVDYEFTRDPTYLNENSKIITFNGLDVRPGSYIDKLSFTLPFKFSEGSLDYLKFQTNKTYIGYSNDFVPITNDKRYYNLNCMFDSTVSGNLVEYDTTSNNNHLTYSGLNPIYKINFDRYYGKKIIDNGLESYFYSSKKYLNYNTFFWFELKLLSSHDYRLMEIYDTELNKYIYFHINSSGSFKIYCDGFCYTSNEKINFNNKIKYIVLQFNIDEINSSYSYFNLYFKEEKELGLNRLTLFKNSDNLITVNNTIMKLFINSTIDIGNFKIFYEDL